MLRTSRFQRVISVWGAVDPKSRVECDTKSVQVNPYSEGQSNFTRSGGARPLQDHKSLLKLIQMADNDAAPEERKSSKNLLSALYLAPQRGKKDASGPASASGCYANQRQDPEVVGSKAFEGGCVATKQNLDDKEKQPQTERYPKSPAALFR
jgi:hypothetical protein